MQNKNAQGSEKNKKAQSGMLIASVLGAIVLMAGLGMVLTQNAGRMANSVNKAQNRMTTLTNIEQVLNALARDGRMTQDGFFLARGATEAAGAPAGGGMVPESVSTNGDGYGNRLMLCSFRNGNDSVTVDSGEIHTWINQSSDTADKVLNAPAIVVISGGKNGQVDIKNCNNLYNQKTTGAELKSTLEIQQIAGDDLFKALTMADAINLQAANKVNLITASRANECDAITDKLIYYVEDNQTKFKCVKEQDPRFTVDNTGSGIALAEHIFNNPDNDPNTTESILKVKRLVQGDNVTLSEESDGSVKITAIQGNTTILNDGATGIGLYKGFDNAGHHFRKIVGGGATTVKTLADGTLEISSTIGGGGDIAGGENIGSDSNQGVIYAGKNGDKLQFRGIKSANNDFEVKTVGGDIVLRNIGLIGTVKNAINMGGDLDPGVPPTPADSTSTKSLYAGKDALGQLMMRRLQSGLAIKLEDGDCGAPTGGGSGGGGGGSGGGKHINANGGSHTSSTGNIGGMGSAQNNGGASGGSGKPCASGEIGGVKISIDMDALNSTLNAIKGGKNLGGTAAVFANVTNNVMNFRGLTAAPGIAVQQRANDVLVGIDPGSLSGFESDPIFGTWKTAALPSGSCPAGQVISYVSGKFVCVNDAGSGGGGDITVAHTGSGGVELSSDTGSTNTLHLRKIRGVGGIMVNTYAGSGSGIEISGGTASNVGDGLGQIYRDQPAGDIKLRTLDGMGGITVSTSGNKVLIDGTNAGAASSQWALNANNIFNKNTGNVGIGTNAPAAKLDVAGSINATGLNVTGNANVANVSSTGEVGTKGTYFVARDSAGGNLNKTDMNSAAFRVIKNNTVVAAMYDTGTIAGGSVNSTGGYSVGANTVIDASRNITAASINGTAIAGTSVNSTGGYTVNSSPFVDTARNVVANNITNSGTITSSGNMVMNGANSNLAITGSGNPFLQLGNTANAPQLKFGNVSAGGYSMWANSGGHFVLNRGWNGSTNTAFRLDPQGNITLNESGGKLAMFPSTGGVGGFALQIKLPSTNDTGYVDLGYEGFTFTGFKNQSYFSAAQIFAKEYVIESSPGVYDLALGKYTNEPNRAADYMINIGGNSAPAKDLNSLPNNKNPEQDLYTPSTIALFQGGTPANGDEQYADFTARRGYFNSHVSAVGNVSVIVNSHTSSARQGARLQGDTVMSQWIDVQGGYGNGGLGQVKVGNCYRNTTDTGGNWSCSSDERLKDIVRPLNNNLEKFNSLRTVAFTWKPESKEFALEQGKKTEHMGLIAQEMQKAFPESVTQGEDGFLKADYTKLIAPIIGAIKELFEKSTSLAAKLETEVKQLRAELATKDAQIASQQKMLDDMNQRLSALEQAASKPKLVRAAAQQ